MGEKGEREKVKERECVCEIEREATRGREAGRHGREGGERESERDIRGERRRQSEKDICYIREGGIERGGETGREGDGEREG